MTDPHLCPDRVAPFPGEPTDAAPRRPRWPLVVGVVGVVAGLLAGGVAATHVAVVQLPFATSPTQAVERYFAAVTAGDVVALTELATTPGTLDHLTGDAIRAAAEAGPVTDLAVAQVAGSPGEVAVTYSLAGSPVSTWMSTTRTEAGWKVDSPTGHLTFPPRLDPTTWGIAANGIPVTGSDIALTPGVWTLTATNPLIGMARPEVTVDEVDEFVDARAGLALTPAGEQAVRAAFHDRLRACTGQRPFVAEDCGTTVGPEIEGDRLVESSLTCSADDASSLDTAALTFDADNWVTADISVGYHCRVDTVGGRYHYRLDWTLDTAYADVSDSSMVRVVLR